MTVREAREFLRTSVFPKPKFGDGATIEAVEIVGLYETGMKLVTQLPVEKCRNCDGEGVIECLHCGNEADCEDCGGTGEWDSELAAEFWQLVDKNTNPLVSLREVIKEMEEDIAASKGVK